MVGTRRLLTAAASLAAAALLLALPPSASAVNIFPNTTEDEFGSDLAECSLREAVQLANGDLGGSFGGCTAADEDADTIWLEAGATYARTLTGVEDMNATGDLDIRDENLTIVGATGSVVRGDGTTAGDRVFHVVTGPVAGLNVQLNGLTIRNGSTTDIGGGVRHDYGNLGIFFSTVSGNSAGSFGGGIENSASSTLLNVFHSTVSGNQANADGGGIDSNGPFAQAGSATITANTADADNAGGGNGGGVFKAPGAGTFRIANTIVAGNFDLGSTGIQAPDCAGSGGFGGSGGMTFGYNLIGSTANCGYTTPGPGDILDMPAGLGPLEDNGGNSFTHELLPGSPAIDMGNPATPSGAAEHCGGNDQRGVARPQGPRCDIGAFEVIPPPPVEMPPVGGTTSLPAATPAGTPPPRRKCRRKKRAKPGAAAAKRKRCKRKRGR